MCTSYNCLINSNEHTQHIFHNTIRKFPWAVKRITYVLKNEFELAMVNKPSVFESLKFYWTYFFFFFFFFFQ